VHGHAHAPRGRPVTTLDVGFRVGPVQKLLKVTGHRTWQRGAITSPEPFTRMPMTYERAFGGFDTRTRETASPQWDVRNPVGTGYVASGTPIDGTRLPNIEYANQLVTRGKDRPAPAGFGPICSHWQPRAGFAGTYDERWEQERQPLLPEDFDDRYYQCAPADQQSPTFLRGGEPVVLLNLTPEGELRFDLPRVHLGLETFFTTRERRRHEHPSLHTVTIEPDVMRVQVVWQTSLPCHPLVHKLSFTRIWQKEPVGRTASSVPAGTATGAA